MHSPASGSEREVHLLRQLGRTKQLCQNLARPFGVLGTDANSGSSGDQVITRPQTPETKEILEFLSLRHVAYAGLIQRRLGECKYRNVGGFENGHEIAHTPPNHGYP